MTEHELMQHRRFEKDKKIVYERYIRDRRRKVDSMIREMLENRTNVL